MPAESKPNPPKSQKFPDASAQLTLLLRAPGTLPAEATPSVPYIPFWFGTFGPAIQIQVPCVAEEPPPEPLPPEPLPPEPPEPPLPEVVPLEGAPAPPHAQQITEASNAHRSIGCRGFIDSSAGGQIWSTGLSKKTLREGRESQGVKSVSENRKYNQKDWCRTSGDWVILQLNRFVVK